MRKKVALSIAGSDSSGGAGIQADLKAFSLLGIHCATVLTCITAQNTQTVDSIYKIPSSFIEKQVDVLLDDFIVDTAKIGMLFDSDIIKCIGNIIKKNNYTKTWIR